MGSWCCCSCIICSDVKLLLISLESYAHMPIIGKSNRCSKADSYSSNSFVNPLSKNQLISPNTRIPFLPLQRQFSTNVDHNAIVL